MQKPIMQNQNSSMLTGYGWLSMAFGYFTLNEWAIVIGMLATIGGFILALLRYLNERKTAKNEERRAQEIHRLRVKELTHDYKKSI